MYQKPPEKPSKIKSLDQKRNPNKKQRTEAEKEQIIKTRKLIPLNKRSPEERKAIQRKGGLARTQKKKDSAKFRAFKQMIERGISAGDKQLSWVLTRIEDNKAMAADIIKFIDDIREEVDDPKNKISLTSVYIQAMKSIHGERIRNENININIETDVGEIEEHLKKILKQE